MMAVNAVIEAAFSGRLGAFSLDVAFRAPMCGITALFGPSGSGKTTVLRCMAGLERMPGRLCLGGDIWQDSSAGIFVRPHSREIGYVFQEGSLFPHLSIRNNLLYGARRATGVDGSGSISLDGVVDLLGIRHLLGRSPAALSGGERQRVAIGRALLSRPRLLLMDEPLSGLDRAARDEILPYLETLHESLALPMIYVSHDMAEVERLADTLVLMENGRVLATGPTATLEADPALPLIEAPEASVMLEGRITAIDETFALTVFSVNGGELVVPGRQGNPGGTRRLRIRASDVSFARTRHTDSTILNSLPARLVSLTPHGRDEAQVNIVAALGAAGEGARIVARITRKSQAALDLSPGVAVFAQIKSVALVGSGAGPG